MVKDFKVSIQVYNTQHSTQHKATHSKIFWPRSTILISKSAKYCSLQKFVTEIFQVKIELSPELMSDIFKFVGKPYFLPINSQFRPEDPNDKIWHITQENTTQNLFPNECKAIVQLLNFKLEIKTQVLGNYPSGLWKTYSPNRIY